MEEENNNFKNSTSKKYFYFFITLLILITALRATNLTEFLYDDEANFAYTLSVMDNMGVNQNYHSPIPLNLLYIPLISIFGLKIWVFRLLPLIFSVINTLILYKYTQEKYNNKKLATIAASLMLITFYPTLAALQFDVEGNLIMTCALLTFYFYDKFIKQNNIIYNILAGIALGIAIIAKQNAAILAIIFLIYAFIINFTTNKEISIQKKTTQYLKDSFTVGTTAIIIFSLSLLYAFINNPETWLNIIISPDTGRYYSKHFSILGPSIYFLWATPLLILSPLFLILKEKLNKISPAKTLKNYSLEYIWIITTLLFYTFIITFGAIDKYFMHTIPALCILTAALITKINWSKKNILIISGIIFIFTTFLFYLNTLNLKQVARFPKLYLQEILNLNLAFIFSYTSSSGPMLGISFATIFFTTVISVILLLTISLFYLIKKRKKTIKPLIIIFLAITFSFNIFLTIEYLFHPTSPDISTSQWQAINYIKENNPNYPIYSNNQGIHWYYDHNYWHNYENVIGFADNEIDLYPEKAINNIKNRKGTIILTHWPPLHKNSPAHFVSSLCEKTISFSDKNTITTEIFEC